MARNPGRTVFIGNWDEKVFERVLYEILIQAGHVVDLYIPCDKENNRPKCCAFAEYETEEIAHYAVRLFSGLVRINDKLLKFMIAGHDKPSSNVNNPVMPKLNPTPPSKQNQFMHCTDMPVSHTPAYPVVNSKFAGYDNPSSNGSNPVMPKLSPIPLPKQSQFMHRSDMPASHTPAYPAVNSRIAGYGVSPNLSSYGVHPQALSGGPVHSHGMYDYSRHELGSALNVAYRGPVLNAFAHEPANQPIMYPSY